MNIINFKMTKVKYGIAEDSTDAVNIFINGENFQPLKSAAHKIS